MTPLEIRLQKEQEQKDLVAASRLYNILFKKDQITHSEFKIITSYLENQLRKFQTASNETQKLFLTIIASSIRDRYGISSEGKILIKNDKWYGCEWLSIMCAHLNILPKDVIRFIDKYEKKFLDKRVLI